MGSLLKKFAYSMVGILLFSLMVCYSSYAGTYINTYYKDDKSEEISKGVTHISGVRLTSNGLIKTEIIKVDLSNNKLKFKNVFNSDSMGKKTTLNNLVKKEDDVVAAINGDFFEISLTPSFELGLTINDGKVQKLSSGEYYNCYSDSLAALLLDKDNDPLIDFVKSNIIFENDNDQLYISYYNKSGDKEGTVILDGDFFSTSLSMDNRNPNTYKIVVKKGKSYDEIIDIIEPGTTIDITGDIYVVFLPVNFNRIENFEIGDKVSLSIDLTCDDIETAIGGAGIFLQNGKVVSNGYIVSSTTARSFVGYDSRKKFLYFGTVGGLTSTNVGVSSGQLGELLLDYGISTAMHLDGGGSSTLLAKKSYSSSLYQVNDVSTQRAIINALVLKNNSTSTRLAGIGVDLNGKAIYNVAIPFKVYGYDESHKEISNFRYSNLKITADKDIEVDTNNLTIIFKEKGRTNVKVSCSGYTEEISVDVYETLSEIQILPDPIIMDVNDEVELKIIAFTGENYKIPIDASSCNFTFSSKNLAKIKNNKIVGMQNGVGTVTVEYDGLTASSVISIGKETVTLDDFNYSSMKAVSYPESVYTNIEVGDGLTIDYAFEESNVTQAAYAKYDTSLIIPKGTTSLLLTVKGDGKGCSLKVKLVDSNGEVYNQVVCNELNIKSKKEYEIQLPSSYSGTLSLERIYVVSTGTNKEIDSSVKIYNLKCIKSLNYSNVYVPKSVTREIKAYDDSITLLNDSDFIFYNNSSNALITKYLDYKIEQTLSKINDRKLVLSKNNENMIGIINNDGLKKYYYGDTLLISMSTINGSAFDKDPYQYEQIENIINDSDTIENVIITLDGDLTSSTLAKDKTMLDYILSKCYEKKRINYYLIMFAGKNSNDIISNGIRYITVSKELNDVYGKNVLVLRVNNSNELKYNFVSYAQIIKQYDDILEEEKLLKEEIIESKNIDEELEMENLENENNEGGEDDEE